MLGVHFFLEMESTLILVATFFAEASSSACFFLFDVFEAGLVADLLSLEIDLPVADFDADRLEGFLEVDFLALVGSFFFDSFDLDLPLDSFYYFLVSFDLLREPSVFLAF